MAPRKIINLNNMDSSEHPDDKGILSPGPGRESFKLAQFWKGQVEAYDRATARWVKKGNTIVKRFRDERNRIDEEGQRRMNLLWSNIKVMKPAIYSKCPIPIVDRKFLDRDPVGRLSSVILERSLKNELDNGFHTSMGQAVLDKLLPGRGILWIRYEPKFGEGPSLPSPSINGMEDELVKIGKEFNDKGILEETDQEEQLEESGNQLVEEKVIVDYVDWKDLYLFPVKARTWAEVQAVGKKVHISKQEAIERFGEKIGKSLKPDTTPMASGNTERLNYSETAVFQDINERNIVVFEIWNKSDKRVYWHSTGYMYLCDVKDDPLELADFFPVPPPMLSTFTNDTITPVPDFLEWQDQAIQIDELTQRIAMLTKACKVAGAYNAANTSLKRLFNESVENELIPVDQWALFAEQGGLKGAIDFVPIEQIQSTIKTLQEVRQQAMIDLDQVTGLSDVIRGTSDSRETLGGLRLKNNNAGTRLSESQEDVARFARDVIRIISEIICKHFDDETLIRSSGILYQEELQPDVILRELQANQPPAPPLAQPPAQPMGGPGLMPGLMPGASTQPQLPPMGGMQPPMPNNNVVPFPSVPQLPMGGMPPPAPLMPQPQLLDPQIIAIQKILAAIKLLREDVLRNYRIDIETDSTIFGDKMQERQDATEFIGAVGQFMKQFQGIAETTPEAMPLLGKMLQWGVRKYRTGRDLELEVDSFVNAMDKKAKEMANNPKPSPEEMKTQAEIKQLELEGEIQRKNDERDAQKQAMNDEREARIQQADDTRQLMMQKAEQEHKERLLALEQNKAVMEHRLEMEQLTRQAQFNKEEHEFKLKELAEKARENKARREEQARKAKQPKKRVS